MFKYNYIKSLFLIVIISSKTSLAQIQPWLGFQQITSTYGVLSTKPQLGFAVGITYKDKLIFKYAITSKTEKSDYNFGSNNKTTFEDIEKTNMFSTGWIFSKPSNKSRVGLGLTFFFNVKENNRYQNGIYQYGMINKEWFKGALPFIYFDTRINNRISLVVNSLLFINEIGLSYRFGKIVPLEENKIINGKKKKTIIFH